ncbi:MAG: hypothetical protein A3H76_05740 [Candidatus Lloydbacteria bacterium RIFCSPLOWO2_02_FULL_54_12]|nr:MAG: hypothetical protein A3H76_05740 [Candidatus Lloydbacteria bacterium RIFCSPLOWO2_02_FULL_54_12]
MTPSSPALDAYIGEIAAMKEGAAGKYSVHESSLFLPLDEKILAEAESQGEKYVSAQLRYIVVIGIGGSNLGAKAVYDALRGTYDPARPQKPKLVFLDTLSHDTFRALDELFEARVEHSEQVLINIVSKSGTTAESVANFALLYRSLAKRLPDIASRIVATTDRDSLLWKAGEKHGWGLLAIPLPVGGRFSVFSAVGLFPLLAAGIDVREFCRGAAEMCRAITSPDETNPARRPAEELFAAMRSGCSMVNLFYFHPELESLGKWERQLIAESLGKEKDVTGKTVHAGITPLVSIGSTDLHSMAQLYFGGPRDKFTLLIRASETKGDRIPEEGPLSDIVPGLAGKETSAVMDAIYRGVSAAYKAHALPHGEVLLSTVSSHALGQYMEWRMATVMYLAKLMKVNAFDQPNVEDYKSVTKKLLQ